MILRRSFDAVLSALDWLIDILFPQAVILVIALGVGLGALCIVLIWRSRGGRGPPPLPAAASIRPPRRRDRLGPS